jgi:hypothetical protein
MSRKRKSAIASIANLNSKKRLKLNESISKKKSNKKHNKKVSNTKPEDDLMFDMSDLNKSLPKIEPEPKTFADAATQTENFEFNLPTYMSTIHKYFGLPQVYNLICIFIDSFENFNSINKRLFSVIIFIILRILKVPN